MRGMTPKPVMEPGPEHPITIAVNPKRVVVRARDRVIADTRAALTLRESTYPAVQYIPREHVDMTALSRTTHATYCPYKGECSYFSIPDLAARGTNAVWSYEAPHGAVGPIKDHLAFYPDRVTIQES